MTIGTLFYEGCQKISICLSDDKTNNSTKIKTTLSSRSQGVDMIKTDDDDDDDPPLIWAFLFRSYIFCCQALRFLRHISTCQRSREKAKARKNIGVGL